MRAIRALLLVAIFLAAACTATGKPRPPVRLGLTFERTPAVGKPAVILVSLATDIELPASSLVLDLPPGITPAEEEQSLAWEHSLEAAGHVCHRLAVLIDKPGEYCFTARLSTDGAALARRNLYLVIGDDIAVFSNRSMHTARREAILARYRRDSKLPVDAELSFDDLPARVQAQLEILSSVQVALPEQVVEIKQLSPAPDANETGAEAADEPATEIGETKDE